MKRYYQFLVLFAFLCCCSGFSQTKDSIVTTQQQMQKLEELSKKGKFTRQLHKLLVRKKTTNVNTNVQAVKQADIDYDFEKFQGKIIRNINIETYDPFGFSIQDSTRVPTKQIEKLGNRLHLKTKQFTVRSLLLFKRNQPLDSIKLKESERLLRTQRYIRRVSVKPINLSENNDSVDIEIKVLDSWSWYPTGSLSTSSARLNLTTRNFGGLGHYFNNQYRTRFKEGRHAYRTQYQVNNIGQTFIDAGVFYNLDLAENYTKQIYANRRFFTPMTRLAGGFTLLQNSYRDSVPNLEGLRRLQSFKSNDLDLWLGHSMPLYYRYNNLHKVQTNLVTSLRYFSRNYTEHPIGEYDPYNYYTNQKLYLATVGLASLNYVQDRYIFYYDVIEDIAVGKTFMVTAGIQQKNNINRPYIGAKFSLGKYTNSGYFGGDIQWGTFMNGNHFEEGVLRIEGLYFSKLYHWGKWRFRHFFNPEIVVGLNRWDYAMDKITLNGAYGIDGFDSYELRGTKKVLLNLQLQSYAPYEVLGFRFSPFFSTSIGFMGDNHNRFVTKDMYSKIGLGVVISNDYLVFNNFQLSLAFYPSIPGNGHNIFKTNNLRNTNFDLQQFNYGKPELVPYN
ncbi:hypothetical protein SAMN05421741_10829 [Paenimyroides ummariense]|uniref:Outer membrane protein assembly factor BamA n=1 Tax=Paenimyroides ummariense TaxID=913024 RepID=A0A1I5AFG4_9FLAO|nr:hypothetical protein [Paenimyroides ummariense]SFN61236.1 hypothetical protein SAMN05421741_10829 [Paenimyroides ummariense]